MPKLTQTAMLFIEKTLITCEQCDGFFGAALASPDGLVLAVHGQLSGDEAAACASSLFIDSTTSLSYINESAPRMMLIWTDRKILALHQLQNGSIFIISSTELNNYHAVLKFSIQIAQKLNQALGMIG